VARGRGETPVLAAAGGPERVAPPQSGSSTVPYQGFKIYEQPAPPDDSAENEPATPPQAARKPAPVAPPPAATLKPAPIVAPPTRPSKTAATALPAPAKPGAAPPAKSVAALIQQANSVPVETPPPKPPSSLPAIKQATTSPQNTPSATGAPRALNAAAPATPKTVIPAPTPSPPKPAPTLDTAEPAAGSFVLQIGAFKSQADAEAAWKAYKVRHTALVAGYSDDIQQANLGEKGIWYRLRIGGLSDKEVATALCDRLKADGGACILGR
jgi:hypothetical protein